MESYSVTGNFQGFPQSARAPDRFQLYLSLGELLHRWLTRLQVFAFETALFSLLVWSFPCEL